MSLDPSQTSLYPFCCDHRASEKVLAGTGVAHTILRIAFYQDMFVGKVDPSGAVWALGGQGRGAFISREDTAWAIAAAVMERPGRVQEITGPQLLSVGDMVRRLSAILGMELREEDEAAESMRKRLRRAAKPVWMQDLEIGWFQAINAGEQAPVSTDFKNLVGREAQTVEAYMTAFPEPIEALRRLLVARRPREPGHTDAADLWASP